VFMNVPVSLLLLIYYISGALCGVGLLNFKHKKSTLRCFLSKTYLR